MKDQDEQEIDDMPLPDWVKEALDKEIEAFEKGEVELLKWEDIKDKIIG